ncbi:Gfo/Idh/MocA family protein [Prosthecomicrobium pneumaticum]|uniref:Putative dehydrogenase n=1 Tax=Prosthecomicrobium pneumaticum TaxID=81895 RepID=A0A7W9FQV6_9HYPH|nr:Gfo/Idh/MocA family oxidoreductase [Prosthecomicrobium pneumaticum]MBB5755174.1 putative dehydrogenase [Prosthecomicrobium pneumaticum]
MPVSEKLKIVQVGLGGWGWSWTDIVKTSPDWTLAAVVDIDAGRLKQAAAHHGLADSQLHTTLASAVAATRPDACLVVVPPEVHAPVTIEAARLGLHCLVEKPIAGTVADAKAMVAAAAEAGIRLMVNQNYRFRRAPRTVKKLIADGVVGEVGSVSIQFQKAAHFGGGFREKMAHPLVVDMAIHHFDQLRGSIGFEPVEVTARSWNPKWSWFDGDAAATATFRSASGAVAVYSGSWVSQGWQTTWDGDWRIQGTEGELHWADNAVSLLPKSVFTSVFVPGAREREGRLDFDLLPLEVEDRLASLSAFHRAVASGEEAETSGADNLRTLATVLAVRLSVERGETVTLEEVLSSDPAAI